MRMKDNQYQWFRAAAEVIRRLDGSASRIAGIFIKIDAEKKEIMQAQKSAAFHRAFTKADLCEYYVNLEANTFDTLSLIHIYKRLELGAFNWPRTKEEALEITPEQYQYLMQGLEIVARHPVQEVRPDKIL